MARRRRDIARPPAVPPPTARSPRATGRSRPESSAESVEQAEAVMSADLNKQYAHVRRDLIRIAVLAVVVFGLIFASRFMIPLV